MKFTIVFVVLILIGCSAASEKLDFNGELIYVGQGLFTIDLSDGNSEVIKEIPGLSVNEISRIDNSHFLVSTYDLKPSASRKRVGIYSADSKKIKYIVDGSNAIYISDFGKIVFYDNNGNLVVSEGVDPINIISVIDDDSTAFPVSAIQISDYEIIFASMRAGRYGVWKYNFKTSKSDEFAELKNCSLDYALWNKFTKEILCSEILDDGVRSKKYFLTGLEGDRRDINFGDGRFWPVAYLGSSDAIILQERISDGFFSGERHPLHIYKFIDGSKTEIASDVLLSRSVIYIEK